MEMNSKNRTVLLLASAAVLALALILWWGLEKQDPNRPVVEMLEARGYSLSGEQLYHGGSFTNQSIQQVLSGVSLEEAVAASQAGGFPSDVERAGEVTLLLCALGNGDVITLFLLDGQMELCFIQPIAGGSLKPLESGEALP